MPEELKLVVSAEDRASRIFGEIGRVASETFRRIRSQITYTNRALGRLEEKAAPLFATFARRAEADALPAIEKVSAELKKVFGEISAALGESSKRMTALGRVSERSLAKIVRGVETGKKSLEDFGTRGEKAVWGVLGMVVALDRAMWGLPPPLRRTAEIVTSLIGLWRIAGREMWRIAPFVGVVASLSLALTGLAAVVGVVSRAFREMYGLVEKTIRLGAEYESLIVRVKIVSDLSSASLRDMSAEFAELATQIPISAAELMKIAREAAKLGIEGRENILAFTRTVAIGAIVTGESAATITDRLGRVALAFGLPIKEAGRLLETLHVLAIKGPQEVDEIIIAMRKMAPAAKILGLPIEVSAALGAALTAMGVSAARAGTQVYRALVEMTKATDEQLTAAGVDVLEFRRALEVEPAEAIRLLLESLARLERRSDRLRAATELLGSVGAKAFALLAANVEEYDKYLELANRTMLEGAEFAEALAEISMTTRARYQMLRAEIERMAYALWNEIQPAVAGAVKELHFMIRALSESEVAQAALGRAAEILSGIFGAGVVAIKGVVSSLDDYWKILTDIPPSIRLLGRLMSRLASLFVTAERKTRDFSDILGRTTFVLVKTTEAVLDFGASFVKLGAYIVSVFPPLSGFLIRLSWILDATRKNVAEQAEHTAAWEIVRRAIRGSGLLVDEQIKLLDALRRGQIEPLITRLEELGFRIEVSSEGFKRLEAPVKLTERRFWEVQSILEILDRSITATGKAFDSLREAKRRGQIGAEAYAAVLEKMGPVFRILRDLTAALAPALEDVDIEVKKTTDSFDKAGKATKFATDADKKYIEALIKMIEAQVVANTRILQGEFEAKRLAAALRTGKESIDLQGRSAKELENYLRSLMSQTDQLRLTYGKLMGALEKQIRGEKERRAEIIGLIQDERELILALQKHLGLSEEEAVRIAETRQRLEEQREATRELINEYWNQFSVLDRLKEARRLLKEAIYGEAEAYEKARARMVQAVSDQIDALADYREKFKTLFREISSGTIRNVADMQKAGASIVGDLQNILETGKEVDYNLVLEWQKAMTEMQRIAGYTGEEIPAVWKRIDAAITKSATAARIIWTDVAMRMGTTFEHLRDFWFEISDAMYRAFADAIFLMMTESENKLKELEAIFTSFVRSIARAISEFIAKEFVREFFRLLARGAGGMAGGGIVVPAFRAAQRGEVVRGPALRLVGEREPEAIVPLPGGRAIPVEIRRERERPITVVNVVDPESIYRAIMDRPDVVWNLVSFDIARGGITQRTIRGYRRLV